MTLISIHQATVLHPLSFTNQKIVSQFSTDFYEAFESKEEKVKELREKPREVLKNLPSIAALDQMYFVGKSDQGYDVNKVLVKVLTDDLHDDELAFFKKLLQQHAKHPDRVQLTGVYIHRFKTLVLIGYNGIVVGTEQHRNTFLEYYS